MKIYKAVVPLLLCSFLAFQANAQDVRTPDQVTAEDAMFACAMSLAFLKIVEETSRQEFESVVRYTCKKQIERVNDLFGVSDGRGVYLCTKKWGDCWLNMYLNGYDVVLSRHKQMYQRRQ